MIEKTTVEQWKCKEWHKHKTGLITSSIAHRILTMQNSIDKGLIRDPSNLVNTLVYQKYPSNTTVPDDPKTPRHWGLKHESSARQSYSKVECKRHHKLTLVSKGLLQSKSKPFIAASVDNIRLCSCATNCPNIVVEFKCPMKHRNISPNEAFLTPEVGGKKAGNKFFLKPTCPYYTQVQIQMFVTRLKSCDFVVWTEHGIMSVQVQYDAVFMDKTIDKLQRFWMNYVLPFMVKKLSISLEIKGNFLHVNIYNTIVTYICYLMHSIGIVILQFLLLP